MAADVFRYLVTPSGAKIAHGVGDLAEYASVDERRLLPVLMTLGRERIVRPVDGATGRRALRDFPRRPRRGGPGLAPRAGARA